MSKTIFARAAVALLAGAFFGFGLALSGMVDPTRVVGFLDVASGHWDPSVIFVLCGALIVAVPGVVLQRKVAKPVLDAQFHLPLRGTVDTRLLVGSAIFGAGWGLAGFCPGPAVTALPIGQPLVLVFVGAMVVGMIFYDRLLVEKPL